MPNWKKVIVSGSNAILNNITASGDISASGDIYATNFIGTVATSSVSEKVKVSAIGSPGGFPVVFTGTTGKYLDLYKDDTTADFYYNPSLNTLYVTNLSGTASLATTAVTASYISAANIEGGVAISNNTNNRILTATGTQTINGESDLTFNGTTLSLTGNFTINPQGYVEFVDIGSNPGGGYAIIGDQNENNNSTYFKVDDENSNIIFSFGTTPTVHTFDSTGLNVTGSLTVDTIVNVNTTHVTASGNIKANGYVSASGDVYADNVRTDTIIFPNTNGKIITPDGQVNDDYIALDGTDRYFSVTLDATDLLKVDFNNELITLGESTKHGSATNDTHQFTGSVDIKGNTNVDGNLTINGDITAEQYIVNSTVTNVTMSFSSGSTIFGDSLDDTHLLTGSVDVTGSLTVDGMTYPTTDGEDGQVLLTDGSGALTFGDIKVYAQVKNISGVTLTKGTPVHATASASPPAGNISEVVAASASLASTMPATFILDEELANDAEGRAILSGFINGVDTSAFSEGDVVYVGAGGGYTNIKPTGSNLIQNLGIITKVDGSNGAGYIYGSGRSNDVPNLPSGYAWVGGTNGVANPTPTSSFAGVGDNLGNHIATQDLDMAGFSISASLSITASGNISASGDIIGNSLSLSTNPTISGSVGDSIIDISLSGDETYKLGVIKREFNFDDPANINDKEIATLNTNNFVKGIFQLEIKAKGYNVENGNTPTTNTSSLEQKIYINRDTEPAYVVDIQGDPELYTIYYPNTPTQNAYNSFYQAEPYMDYDEVEGKLKLNFTQTAGANNFYSNSDTTVIVKYEIYNI
jgi:cytoskeletal protein CcmA (bactofilin family)